MARLRTLHHLVLLLALAGCQGGDLPPPEATPAQIAREQAFLRAEFLSNPCFVAALDAAKPLNEEPAEQATYSIVLAPSALSHDGLHYQITVRTSDRVATVTRSGGYFGVYEMLGPIPLSRCLQPVFRAARS